MVETINTITIALTIIALLITLIAPIQMNDQQRLFAIAIIFFIFLTIILSNFNKRLDSNEEKLKIHEQLIDIKAELKSLRGKNDKRK